MHASSNSQGAFVCVRVCVRPGFAEEKGVHLIDNTLPANTHLSQIGRGAWQQPAGGHHSQVHCGMPNHMSLHMSTHRSIHMSIHMSMHVYTYVYTHAYVHVYTARCVCGNTSVCHCHGPDMLSYLIDRGVKPNSHM